MKNDITVLVNSCDAYEDIWYPFFKLFDVYWHDCPYRIILNTESKSFNYDGINIETFNFYQPGEKVPYGERMLKHLSKINTKYILVLIDDFFFNDYIDEEEIERCREWMEKNDNIAVFSFAPFNDKNNIKSDVYIGYEKRPNVGVYKVNFQAALWRTTDFVNSWKRHESPWDWEKYGTFRSFFSNKEYYSRIKEMKNPIDYGAKYGDAWNIVAGLWVVDSVDQNFKRNGINIDYSKRGVLECSIKELPRDHKKKTINDVFVEIKSIGFGKWMYQKIWRLIRIIKKTLGLNVEQDYYEFLYNKRH